MLDKLKQIIKDEGLNGKDMANLLGIEYDSYRSMTRSSSKNPPRWVRAFVIGYNLKNK